MENNNNNNNDIYKPLPTDKPVENPILPKSGERNVLITSALPYVNNVPHLGNIVGSVLSADVYSRYCKLRGYNTIYICGTDEYGTATETKALQEGMTPREICDKYNAIHREVYEWFDIKFDKFGRTSTKAQEVVCQQIFVDLHKNQNLVEEENQQLYCEKCQKFLADRFVEGICPLCKYKDARGDQCDSCGKLINAVDLIEPRCKVDGTTPVVKSTKHLNIDLPKLAPKIESFVNDAIKKGIWSTNAQTITHSWLKEGLRPRAITRDLKWGVPVPLESYKDKVFYVWYDAPIGYISITANYTDQWEQWWKNSKDVELVQFMGKDNVPFHTVMFPGSLLGSDSQWTTLHSISTTEYLNYENDKFSKSRGIGVFGLDAKNSGIPSEVWRYYLLANRPEVSDSSFSWDDLKEKNNGELLANLGNFVNRALTFCKERLGGVVPEIEVTDFDKQFVQNVNKELEEYFKFLDKIHIKDGLKVAMAISKLGNGYFQETKPWELLKENNLVRCKSVIGVILNLIKLLGTIFEPYMPALTAKIEKQLNFKQDRLPAKFELDLPTGHPIGTPQVIFKKLEDKEITEFKSKFGGQSKTQDTFPADIRGAVVVSVNDHPSDDALFLLQVKVGSETRQVVARLKSQYKKEELENRQVVALCNLPPAEIKGCKSEAMLLVAEKKKGKEVQSVLLHPDASVQDWSGTKVEAEGLATDTKHIQLKEFQKLDLKLQNGKVVYKAKHVLKAGNAHITANGVDAVSKIR